MWGSRIRCGGLGAVSSDADKVLILQCLKFNKTYCLKPTIYRVFDLLMLTSI